MYENTKERASKTYSTQTKKTTNKNQQTKIYKICDTVFIGYTSYNVRRTWWSKRLSNNEFLDKKPDASFLFIELTVRNKDDKPRTIPPFKLIDENRAEYETSSKAWAITTEGT